MHIEEQSFGFGRVFFRIGIDIGLWIDYFLLRIYFMLLYLGSEKKKKKGT